MNKIPRDGSTFGGEGKVFIDDRFQEALLTQLLSCHKFHQIIKSSASEKIKLNRIKHQVGIIEIKDTIGIKY